jgi:ComF family protein
LQGLSSLDAGITRGKNVSMSRWTRCRQTLAGLDRTLLPPVCAFCRTPLHDGESGACLPCLDDLPRNDPACRYCGKPLPADPGALPCARCQAKPLPLETVIAPLRYAFPVDVAIQAIKYRGRLEYAAAFTHILLAACDRLPGGIDGIVPVPLHWLRQGRRGFNQALELARPVANELGVPLAAPAIRSHRTAAQTGLGALERRRNLKGAFDVREPMDGCHILIVDDVMTTGATLVELARCLGRAGAEQVSALVVARAVGDGLQACAELP